MSRGGLPEFAVFACDRPHPQGTAIALPPDFLESGTAPPEQ